MTQNPSRPPHLKKAGVYAGLVRAPKVHGLPHIGVADFQKLVDGWIIDAEYRRLSPRTIEMRRDITARLYWWMNRFELSRLDTDAMRRFFAYAGSTSDPNKWGRENYTRVKPISAATLDTYYVYLQTWFNWAVSEGLLAVSPLAKVARPDQRSVGGIVPFSRQQVCALLEAAKFSQFAERDAALVSFLIDTGVRVSEFCSVAIGDVDRTEKSIRVVGKGSKPRTVRFGRETSMALWRYLRTRHDGSDDDAPLFAAHAGNHSGSPLTRSGVQQIITRLADEAKIKGVRCSPHTFRHTFASQFLDNGGNLIALKQLLGHSNIKTTARYVAEMQSHLSSQHITASPMDNLRKKR